MKQCAFLITAFFLISFGLSAQTIDDALRYSARDRIGTARGYGVGSSMSAIGGDFGSIAANPAGLGMFKRSEFQISPAIFNGKANSQLSFPGGEIDDDRTRFMLPSVSYVQVNRVNGRQYYGPADTSSYYQPRSRYGWTRTVLGIGINRVANFNRRIEFEGEQDYSITQMFIEQSNLIEPDFLDNFIGGPAYDAFITAYDVNTGNYVSDIDATEVVNKSQSISRKGGIDELSVSFGADYANKLQLGGSINLPIYHFKEKKKYKETLSGHPIFNELQYDENLNVKGSGINLKLGAKYIVAKNIHLAAAFHTPTWIQFTEEYDTRAYYDYTFDPDLFPSAGPAEEASPLGEFEYAFRSPWRATAGLGVIIGKIGFLTAETEYVDYASSKFTINDDPGYENQLNDQIDFELGNALNLRVGGEVRIKQFRVRGGLGFEESAYANISGLENNSISLGFGFWIDNVFFDLAYRRYAVDQRYSPYTISSGPSPIVNTSITDNNFLLTFGVKI